MNWYKTASLIDNVQIASYTGNSLVLTISGKRYEYSGIPGTHLASEIDRWKKWKNKNEAGKRMSGLLRNLQPNLWKEPNPHQPTPTPAPSAPKPQQLGLFE